MPSSGMAEEGWNVQPKYGFFKKTYTLYQSCCRPFGSVRFVLENWCPVCKGGGRREETYCFICYIENCPSFILWVTHRNYNARVIRTWTGPMRMVLVIKSSCSRPSNLTCYYLTYRLVLLIESPLDIRGWQNLAMVNRVSWSELKLTV